MNQVNESGLRIKESGELDLDYYIFEARRQRSEMMLGFVTRFGGYLKKSLHLESGFHMTHRHSH